MEPLHLAAISGAWVDAQQLVHHAATAGRMSRAILLRFGRSALGHVRFAAVRVQAVIFRHGASVVLP